MRVLLALGLVFPAAGVVLAAAIAVPALARRAVQLSACAAAVAWLPLVVHRRPVGLGAFHADGLGAAAACGAAAVAVALLERETTPDAVLALAAALAAVAAGIGGGLGSGSAIGPAVALAAVTAAGAVARRTVPWLALLGAGAVGVAVAWLHRDTASWRLPSLAGVAPTWIGLLLALGCALLVVEATRWVRGPLVLLLPAAGALLVKVGPWAHGVHGPRSAGSAVALVGVAVLTAALAARAGNTVMAAALLGIAAACGAGAATGAAALLVASATFAVALDDWAAAPLAVPGAIALVLALAATGGAWTLAEGLAVGVVALVWWGSADPWPARIDRPRPATVPTAALALWLMVSPGSWRWAGVLRLGPYDASVARVVAAGALFLATAAVWDGARAALGAGDGARAALGAGDGARAALDVRPE